MSKAIAYWSSLDGEEKNLLMTRLIEDARQFGWSSAVEGLTPSEKYRFVYEAAAQRSKQRDKLFLNTLLGE